jgi:hypothetical protein
LLRLNRCMGYIQRPIIVFHGTYFVSPILLFILLQIKLQESPEDMPAGQTPHTIVLFAHNDLVDKVQPGDRVNVTGKDVGLSQKDKVILWLTTVYLTF